MNNLKDLANRAKNRLLNRALRETYSNASISGYNNMNFQDDNKSKEIESMNRKIQFKYLLRENKMMDMSAEDKERFILATIRKYHEDRKKQEREIG